jgi:biopolymer transport protein ExbD
MKIRGAKKVHYDSGPNMTPLVDVVMVVLVFLMLAGSFVGTEHYMVSNMPIKQKGAGGQAPPGYIPDELLDIRVDSPTPDRFVARAGKIQVGDVNSLTAQLSKMRQDYENAGTKTGSVQVVISPGRDVKYKFLIQVYEAALNAQFTKVAFATSH